MTLHYILKARYAELKFSVTGEEARQAAEPEGQRSARDLAEWPIGGFKVGLLGPPMTTLYWSTNSSVPQNAHHFTQVSEEWGWGLHVGEVRLLVGDDVVFMRTPPSSWRSKFFLTHTVDLLHEARYSFTLHAKGSGGKPRRTQTWRNAAELIAQSTPLLKCLGIKLKLALTTIIGNRP